MTEVFFYTHVDDKLQTACALTSKALWRGPAPALNKGQILTTKARRHEERLSKWTTNIDFLTITHCPSTPAINISAFYVLSLHDALPISIFLFFALLRVFVPSW